MKLSHSISILAFSFIFFTSSTCATHIRQDIYQRMYKAAQELVEQEANESADLTQPDALKALQDFANLTQSEKFHQMNAVMIACLQGTARGNTAAHCKDLQLYYSVLLVQKIQRRAREQLDALKA